MIGKLINAFIGDFVEPHTFLYEAANGAFGLCDWRLWHLFILKWHSVWISQSICNKQLGALEDLQNENFSVILFFSEIWTVSL